MPRTIWHTPRPIQPAKGLAALRGITNADLAAELSVSAAYIGRVLNGQTKPSPELRSRIATILDAPERELFAEDPNEVIIGFVRRTTEASNVPECLEDPAVIAQVAGLLGSVQ